MFFTYFRRNIKYKPFLILTLFFAFFPNLALLRYVQRVSKISAILLIVIGTFFAISVAAFFVYLLLIYPYYIYKFHILISRNSNFILIQWYQGLKKYCYQPWQRNPKILLPLKAVLEAINALGPVIYLSYDLILDAFKQFQIPSKSETIAFSELPLTIQYRLFELQTPVNKFNLAKANPTKWILKASNNLLVVDSFQMDLKFYNRYNTSESIPAPLNIEPDSIIDGREYFTIFCEPFDHLYLRLLKAGKLKNRIKQLQKIHPLKAAFFASLDRNQFPVIIKNCNLSSISRLEIVYSFLNKNDLNFIKELKNLDFIRLYLKNKKGANDIKFLKHLLRCISGIPNVRIYFDCFYTGSFMETLLIDWVAKFGYIKTLSFTFQDNSIFADDKYISFASEKDVAFIPFENITEKYHSLIFD